MFISTDCNEDKFATSAASLALHSFHWQYATLVLFNSTFICNIEVFLRTYQKNVIVSRGAYYPSFVKKTRQYVLFGADLLDIVQMLSWMQKHKFDNTGKYIVICQSEQRDMCDAIDVVNILWKYKVINVVLINNGKEKTVNAFTYYQPEDCKNIGLTNLKNLNSCLSNFKSCQNMYPLKLKNLHQCQVIVSTFNQVPYMNITNSIPTGADGDLLRVIAEAMNFSLVIMTPRIGNGWGIVDENGTWSGSLADVYYEWANFSMTFACTTITRFTTFHLSTDYSFITIAWVTHPSDVLPPSLKLFRPFQPYVRIAIAISFVMVVLFKILTKSNFMFAIGDKLNIRFTKNIVFHSWEMCMGLPVTVLPTNKTLLCLVAFWIWYCFLIRTFYQVCLINSLQTDVFTSEFDTIEEYIGSKYIFGGGLPLKDYYIDNALVYDEWQKVESVDIHPTMMKITQGLKFVLAMNLETAKMFLSGNPDKKLHILPHVVMSSPTVIYFKKYSPLVNPLNVVLSRLKESGIIQKIYLDNTGKKVLKEPLDNKIPITMAHYTGCYAILLIGWLLSTSCFVLEKLVHARKKRLNKKSCDKSILEKYAVNWKAYFKPVNIKYFRRQQL